jgi:hypothetical protein
MIERPGLFQTEEGIKWMLAAAAKADEVDANYERRIGDIKQLRKERRQDFMDWCHWVMEEAAKEERAK